MTALFASGIYYPQVIHLSLLFFFDIFIILVDKDTQLMKEKVKWAFDFWSEAIIFIIITVMMWAFTFSIIALVVRYTRLWLS